MDFFSVIFFLLKLKSERLDFDTDSDAVWCLTSVFTVCCVVCRKQNLVAFGRSML